MNNTTERILTPYDPIFLSLGSRFFIDSPTFEGIRAAELPLCRPPPPVLLHSQGLKPPPHPAGKRRALVPRAGPHMAPEAELAEWAKVPRNPAATITPRGGGRGARARPRRQGLGSALTHRCPPPLALAHEGGVTTVKFNSDGAYCAEGPPVSVGRNISLAPGVHPHPPSRWNGNTGCQDHVYFTS